MLTLTPQLYFATAMIWAAVSDLTTMTIPNRIVVVLLVGFLIFAPFTELVTFNGAAAGAIAFFLGFVLFYCGWIGGGDAKLIAASALWIGIDQLGNFLIATSLFGAVLTLVILAFRAMTLPCSIAGLRWIARLHQPSGGIPYGVAIAAAGCAVLIGAPWSAVTG